MKFSSFILLSKTIETTLPRGTNMSLRGEIGNKNDRIVMLR